MCLYLFLKVAALVIWSKNNSFGNGHIHQNDDWSNGKKLDPLQKDYALFLLFRSKS